MVESNGFRQLKAVFRSIFSLLMQFWLLLFFRPLFRVNFRYKKSALTNINGRMQLLIV